MATENLKIVITAVDKASKKLDGIGKKLGPALAAGGIAAAGFAGMSVKAFAEAEQSQVKLTDAYAKFPQLAGGNIQVLRDLNTEMAKKTKFDDDAFAASQATLAQFGLTQDQIAQMTPLLADYAAKTGKDLPSAAADMGKALLGKGGKAMTAIGVKFKDAGSVAGNFEQIMGGLGDKVGGFAEKEGKTAAGQAEILKNQFGEVQETVGGALMPALQRLAAVLIPLFEFIGQNMSWLLPLAGVLAGIAAAVWLVQGATAAWAAIQTVFNAVMAMNPIVLVIIAIAALVAALVIAYKKSDTFRAIVDGALRKVRGAFVWLKNVAVGALDWIKTKGFDVLVTVIRNSPIGLLVRGVFAAFKWLKEKAVAAFNWIKTDGFDFLVTVIRNSPLGLAVRGVFAAFKWLREKITGKDGVIAKVKGAWDGIVEFFRGLPGRISGVAGGMFDGIKDAFRSVINFIIDGWNSLDFSIPGFDPPGPGPTFPGFTLGVPDIPRMAVGGRINSDGLIYGHKGEQVIPADVTLGERGYGGQTIIKVYTLATDEAKLARELARIQREQGGRGARVA